MKYPEPVKVEQCQKRLAADTVLLDYLLGEESSLLFAVAQDDYQVIRLPGRKRIEASVRKLLSALQAEGVAHPELQALYVRQARALYDLLLRPAVALLKGKRQILLAPDGVLYYVPFPALLTRRVVVAGTVDFPRLPYLVKQYAIRYTPSAGVWSLLGEQKTEAPAPQKNSWLYLLASMTAA